MTPKLIIAVIAVLAIAVGFVLPGPHSEVQAHSQVQLQEVGVS